MTLIKSTEVLERLRDLGQPRSIPRGSSLALEGEQMLLVLEVMEVMEELVVVEVEVVLELLEAEEAMEAMV